MNLNQITFFHTTLSLAFASQDMSIKRITASIWPASDAKCRGVLPV